PLDRLPDPRRPRGDGRHRPHHAGGAGRRLPPRRPRPPPPRVRPVRRGQGDPGRAAGAGARGPDRPDGVRPRPAPGRDHRPVPRLPGRGRGLSRPVAPATRTTRVDPRLLVLAGATLWGTTGTARALGPDDASPTAVGAVRLVIGAACLVLLARAGRLPASPPARAGGGARPGSALPIAVAAVAMAAY